MDQMQQELHDVKQSYVHVCTEKDSVQSLVHEELTAEFEKVWELHCETVLGRLLVIRSLVY